MPRRKAVPRNVEAGARSPITTHVLDTALGRPAAGLAVELAVELEARGSRGGFKSLAHGVTDANGRIADLFPGGRLRRGVYRLTFATAAYFRRSRLATFYPSVTILFEVRAPREHHHVPLLLSPFGYSTYRGS